MSFLLGLLHDKFNYIVFIIFSNINSFIALFYLTLWLQIKKSKYHIYFASAKVLILNYLTFLLLPFEEKISELFRLENE